MFEFFYKYRRISIVFGAFLINISIGNYYAFGNILNDVVKFVNNCSNNCINKNGHWVFGSIVLGMGSAMSLGGYIEMKIGPSLTVLFSGWLFSLMVCLMFFTLRSSLWVIILTFGLIGGMATGVAYGVALGVSLKNFPRNKGLIIGITVSGFGLSASIFEPIQTALKNKTSLGCSFLWIGIIYAVIQVIGSILMNENFYERLAVNRGNHKDCSDSNQSIMINEANKPDEVLELLPHQIIFELDFWILWIILLLNAFCLTFFTSINKRYWDSYNNGTSTNTTVYQYQNISITGAVFNCLGRIFWGFLIDKISFRILNLIIALSISVFIGTFATISFITNVLIYPYIFGIWYSIIYFISSGNLSIFPRMCASLFGMKHFTCNYGMLFTSISISATIVSLINMSYDKGLISMLRNMFAITGAISFLSALLTLVFRGKSLMFYSN